MEILEKIFLENTIKSYLVVAAIIGVVFFFKRLLSHSIASLLYLIIKKKWASIAKADFISLTIKPLSWLLVIVVSVLSIEKLQYPTAFEVKLHNIALHNLLEKIGDTAIIVAFFYFVISFIDFIALLLEQKTNIDKDKSHGQVVIFFRDLLKVIIGIVGLLFVLRAAFNKDIGTLLTGLSIVGAALALAAKESIENLIASFIIFFDKPFFTGDTLKVNNVTGTVERIGLRSTRIRTAEKTLVTVPNKQMVDSVVDNMSMRNQRRAEIKLALSEKTAPAQMQTLLAAVKTLLSSFTEDIVKYTVFFSEYSKDGAIVTIEYFTHPYTKVEYDNIKQQVNLQLMQIMIDQQVELSNSASNITIVNNDADASNIPKQQSII